MGRLSGKCRFMLTEHSAMAFARYTKIIMLPIMILFSHSAFSQESVCKTDRFMSTSIANIRQRCAPHGVSIQESRPLSPPISCSADGEDLRIAKKGVDWVIREDKQAQNTMKTAYFDMLRYGCQTNSRNAQFEAILYAQKHNVKGQCEIFKCRNNIIDVNNNYLDELSRNGDLQFLSQK